MWLEKPYGRDRHLDDISMACDNCCSKYLLRCYQRIYLGLDRVSNFAEKKMQWFPSSILFNFLCPGLKTMINSQLHKVYLSNKTERKICDHIWSKITNVFHLVPFSFDFGGKVFDGEVIPYNLYYYLIKHNRSIYHL